ncbi:TetR family transcriptional regulator [Bacillus aerolatus]|uniref:TetR family transcriptional regulator n=1 Tax=Bacillus aerolatus TaxID=2653354 RepID=A0A6I1FKJ4_9BACI|nr:TetR family transcriptional regulator [Bacillus aerolatus]
MFSKSAANLGSYEIINADWKDNYGLVVILKEQRQFMIRLNNDNFLIPNIKLGFPMVRWIDKDTIVIANPRNESQKDNVFILNLSGTILSSFNGGDGIEGIEVSKEGIWISYFDEGVFGDGISTEGLVLFSFSGNIIFRYHSDLLDRPWIADCYAICKGNGSSIWLFPYTEFPLLQVFPESRIINSYKVPKKLHGSNAICIRGKYAYFYDRYDSNGELFCWEIGKKQAQLMGKIDGTARGLHNGENSHFISISEEFIKLHRIINDDEYNYSLLK